MTKLHKTTTSLFLAAALFLSGCAEQVNSPPQGAENTSSDSSLSDSTVISNSDSTSTYSESSASFTDSESSSALEESTPSNISEESSDASTDTVPVEFTEDDKDLHELLKTLEGINEFEGWLTGGIFDDIQLEKYDLVISETAMPVTYYKLPDDYSINGKILPHTYDGIRDVMLEYLTERFTDDLLKTMMVVGKGSIKEQNPDGSLSITLLNDEHINKGFYKLLEIDGAMYCNSSVGGKGLGNTIIEPETAKVISKTDDTIEFTYLSSWIYFDNKDEIQRIDATNYSEHAIAGVLKYERGGWKRDWDKNDWRLSWFVD